MSVDRNGNVSEQTHCVLAKIINICIIFGSGRVTLNETDCIAF